MDPHKTDSTRKGDDVAAIPSKNFESPFLPHPKRSSSIATNGQLRITNKSNGNRISGKHQNQLPSQKRSSSLATNGQAWITHTSNGNKVSGKQPNQLSVPYPADRAKAISNEVSKSVSSEKSISRNSANNSKTIRFQRQENFDCASLLTTGPDPERVKVYPSPRSERKQKAQITCQMSSFTGEEILSLQEAFVNLDKDGNGGLSYKEIHTALGNMLTEEDINSLMEELDADGDGEIDYQVRPLKDGKLEI